MTSKSASQETEQLEHLELVGALSREITAALSAIEKNDLPAFQAAIANQEKVCHQMIVHKGSPLAASANDTDLVRKAYLELAQLNRVYGGVIKRSKRCADLLAALYSSCGIGHGKEGSERQSLTCEV